MPSYYGKPWVNETKEIFVYQRKSPTGSGVFYYRLEIRGQKARPTRRMASEFAYSPAHQRHLNEKYPLTDPCQPPESVKELAARILSRAKDDISKKGKSLSQSATPTLAVCADEMIKDMEEDFHEGRIGWEKLRRYKGFVKWYVRHYEPFHKIPIDELDHVEMGKWQYWRDRFWTHGPGTMIDAYECEMDDGTIAFRKVRDFDRKPPASQTKTKEKSYLNAVFKWATRVPRQYVGGPVVWDAQANKTDTNPVTPATWFDDDEWNDFCFKASQWIEEQNTKYPKQKEKYYRRHICFLFAILQRAFGLRAAECYALDGDDIKLRKDGKIELALSSVKHQISKKHERTIQPAFGQEELALQTLKSLKPLYQEGYGIETNRKMPLWMQEDGSKVQSFYRVFKTLLKNTGYYLDEHGRKRKLTSIRHTAMTAEILHSPLKEDIIAAWGGTSVEMLRGTYSKAFRSRALKEAGDDTSSFFD